MGQDETIVTTGGCHDCGGICRHLVHVKDGRVRRIETDDRHGGLYRSCLRGRAYRQRLESPDRVLYPLKRIGARGAVEFERISWDEALDAVAARMRHVRQRYGPAALLYIWCSGSQSVLHTYRGVNRLFNRFGGCTQRWGNLSLGGADFASLATYGTVDTGHSLEDLTNARCILLWGWNPVATRQLVNTSGVLVAARQRGSRIICLDPRFTETAAQVADEWLPVRPGSDTALLLAMAYVILDEGLEDKDFITRYTVGFDEFRDYVFGKSDRVPKTPAWAAEISGVPVESIVRLARTYATEKPAALMKGYAPGRTAYGEQFHRAAAVLASITGNIGLPGGNPAGCGLCLKTGLGVIGPKIPTGINPLEADLAAFPNQTLDPGGMNQVSVNSCRIWDGVLRGRAGGYPADFKLLYIVASNCLNQLPNTNLGVKALEAAEFTVIHEQFMTPTARYADIILPVNTHFEREDIFRSPVTYSTGPYYIYAHRTVEPAGETRTDLEIAAGLAERLGIADATDQDEDGWLRELAASAADLSRDIPDYDAFKAEGFAEAPITRPVVAFEDQIKFPATHPFPTPTGKIEIFSARLAALDRSDLPPLPRYLEPWESAADALAAKYPLQLVTYHHLRRAHSCFDNLPWLRELQAQALTINTGDAAARGISDGAPVRVFNDRGQVIVPASVTGRIMPGVVALGEGAWFNPDETGADRGGCANVLTLDRPTPGGALPSNSSLVEVTVE